MDRSRYSEEILKLMDELNSRLHLGGPEDLEKAKAFLDYALSTKDDVLKGYGAFFYASLCFALQDELSATRYFNEALGWFDQCSEYEKMVDCHNNLALIAQYQGSYPEAMGHYFQGLEIAREHLKVNTAYPLLMNMSSICEDAEDYEHALQYRLQCFDLLEKSPRDPVRDDYLLATSAMLVRLYNKLDRMEDAGCEMNRLKHYVEQLGVSSCGLEIYVNELEYAHKVQDGEAEEQYLAQTEKSFEQCEDLLEYFDECLALLRYYRVTKNYERALYVLGRVKPVLSDSVLELHLSLLTEEVGIYEEMGDENRRVHALQEFYRTSCQLNQNRILSLKSALALHENLQQVSTHNKALRVEADTDALTGLWNRRKLNDKADQFFEDADRNRTTLAVAMVDIDEFKHFNDAYGHQKGDDCLEAVASVLSEMEDHNQFSARYGGDEFVILFRDLTDEEILERCAHIRERVGSMSRALQVSSITLSIGVACWIPREFNRIWDYTSAADEAVYWVKANGRNGVRLIHRADELKNDIHPAGADI